MARKLRVQYPGAIYHVMNRGDRRGPIFKDQADRWIRRDYPFVLRRPCSQHAPTPNQQLLRVPTDLSSMPGTDGKGFATTHWSVVPQAGDQHSPTARAALEVLCRAYWPPLLAFVCRAGHRPTDAQDLIQEFFARFLEKNYLSVACHERGRFRSSLLTSLKHFLTQEWRKSHTAKRGDRRATRLSPQRRAAPAEPTAVRRGRVLGPGVRPGGEAIQRSGQRGFGRLAIDQDH